MTEHAGEDPRSRRGAPTAASGARARDLLALTKPAITLSNALMAGVGLLAARSPVDAPTVLATLAGTSLVVASANAFNMVLERDSDALMERTCSRPLAARRLAPASAWGFAGVLGVLGVLVLALGVNLVTAGIGGLAVLVYAFLYTPLKRVTPLALPVGALPGATPPLIGALAASPDELGLGLALAGLLFLWQFPHFLAIAMRRKADYAHAGIRAFSVVHGDRATLGLARWTALGLLPVGLLPHLMGALGLVGTLLLVALGLYLAAGTWRATWVRPTFVASLFYLPGLCCAVLVDHLLS